jgi:hypothetical protein
MRVEHEYTRCGAWAYIAGLDVHHARIFGRCEAKNGIDPFDRLVEQVMTRPPYNDARRVFWIVDNCSAHRGVRAVERLRNRYSPRYMRLPTTLSILSISWSSSSFAFAPWSSPPFLALPLSDDFCSPAQLGRSPSNQVTSTFATRFWSALVRSSRWYEWRPVRVPRCDPRPPSRFNGFGIFGIRKQYRVRVRRALLCVHN